MKKFIKNILFTWKFWKQYASKYRKMLALQIIVCSFTICYTTVISPVIMSTVFSALERKDVIVLYYACGRGALLVAMAFGLCYLNNVYLDMNSFRVQQAVVKGICKDLFSLSYDKINRLYEEGEIQNCMDNCARDISGIFLILISILANMASILGLLILAGRYSILLVGFTFATVLAGYIATKYRARICTRYEKSLQGIEASAGEAMYHIIKNQAVLKMYGVEKQQWEKYQSYREEVWKQRWKQDRYGFIVDCGMDGFTSIIRGMLGLRLFGLYKYDLLKDGSVASAFAIYDQLKGTTMNFTWPVSAASVAMVSVKRMDEILKDGKIKDVQFSGKNTKHLLTIENVSFSVGSYQVLKHVTLSIERGEKVALIGKNGSGKSTLLRIIGGLNHPENGRVSLLGIDPGAIAIEKIRQLITYIPSEDRLYTGSVRQNVYMNTDMEKEEDYLAVCDASEIREFSEYNVNELSGGQAKRINIARAMINKVPLLLADEPDAGLPIHQGRYILENLLNSSGAAIIVTHHHEFLPLFDRVIRLEYGEVYETIL